MPQVNHNDIPRNTKNQQQRNNQYYAPQNTQPAIGAILTVLVLCFLGIPLFKIVLPIASWLVDHAKWSTNLIAAWVFILIVSKLYNGRS